MSSFFSCTLRARGVALGAWVTAAALVMGCSPKQPPPNSDWGAADAPQVPFPASVAGFPFGIGLGRAQQLCGHRLTGTPQKARCKTPPVSLDFAQPNVELDFDSDKLTSVFIRATSWNAAWRALNEKYAAPNVLVEQVKGRWVHYVRHGKQWTHGPVLAEKRRHLSAMWALEGGGIYLLLTNDRVFVWYRSARAQ